MDDKKKKILTERKCLQVCWHLPGWRGKHSVPGGVHTEGIKERLEAAKDSACKHLDFTAFACWVAALQGSFKVAFYRGVCVWLASTTKNVYNILFPLTGKMGFVEYDLR